MRNGSQSGAGFPGLLALLPRFFMQNRILPAQFLSVKSD